MTVSSFHLYFIAWAKNPKLEEAFTVRFIEVGNELNNFPQITRKYVVKSEGDLPTEVSKFIQATKNREDAVYIEPQDLETMNFESGDFVFTMNKELNILDPLLQRFPEGNLTEKEQIWIFEIL